MRVGTNVGIERGVTRKLYLEDKMFFRAIAIIMTALFPLSVALLGCGRTGVNPLNSSGPLNLNDPAAVEDAVNNAYCEGLGDTDLNNNGVCDSKEAENPPPPPVCVAADPHCDPHHSEKSKSLSEFEKSGWYYMLSGAVVGWILRGISNPGNGKTRTLKYGFFWNTDDEEEEDENPIIKLSEPVETKGEVLLRNMDVNNVNSPKIIIMIEQTMKEEIEILGNKAGHKAFWCMGAGLAIKSPTSSDSATARFTQDHSLFIKKSRLWTYAKLRQQCIQIGDKSVFVGFTTDAAEDKIMVQELPPEGYIPVENEPTIVISPETNIFFGRFLPLNGSALPAKFSFVDPISPEYASKQFSFSRMSAYPDQAKDDFLCDGVEGTPIPATEKVETLLGIRGSHYEAGYTGIERTYTMD